MISVEEVAKTAGRCLRIAGLGLIAFGLAVACAHQHGPQVHGFKDIDRWVEVFEAPSRQEWQKPDEVVRALNLQAGNAVADIGAGTGYFTRRFAEAVGPGGRALGLDIEPGMVEYMRRDAESLGTASYESRVVEPGDPGLDPGSVDLVFICNTYHHLEGRVEYLKRLAPALKPGGRVVIVDFYKRALPLGPSRGKLSEADVKHEFRQAGYRLSQAHHFLPFQYFFEFQIRH